MRVSMSAMGSVIDIFVFLRRFVFGLRVSNREFGVWGLEFGVELHTRNSKPQTLRYQLAFVMPGMYPPSESSRKQMRQS